MKKTLAIILLATMLIASILPVVNSSDPVNIPGKITYKPNGGGNNAPIEIVAIWETNGQSNDIDCDVSLDGCQIDPPLHWNGESTVCVYVAVFDPDDTLPLPASGDTNVTKIDISWPNNNLSNRPDLGHGGMKKDNVEPVLFATIEDFEKADAIDYHPGHFICYYNSARDGGDDGDTFIKNQNDELNIKFYKACYQLFYHDPAGWYDADVIVQEGTLSHEKNYFEYVYKLGVDTDFDILNWGNRTERWKWHAIDGNWDWEFYDDCPPTIKNIGNWDAMLYIHFNSDDFGKDDVLFDWRAGESNPGADSYNKSYCEQNNMTGMQICNHYGPLPINNTRRLGTNIYNDALLKCNKTKLDFYIYVKQWTKNAFTYNISVDIWASSPILWQPSPHPDCVPCCIKVT